MAEIIDLTVSPRPEIIEILSDQDDAPPDRRNRQQENRKRRKKAGKASNDLASDGGIGSSTQPSRTHSPEIKDKQDDVDASSVPQSASQPPQSTSSPTTEEPGLFFFDGTAASIAVEATPEPPESNEEGNKLLLPSHVAVSHDDGPIPVDVIPPPKLDSDDEGYIEYLDYEDRKAPGLVRYFEVEGGETNQSRPSIFKCKNCGAEGDHKTYECPIQICLTCGARDEHSTRSCPISKTCYTCGMKGHINKTCPNRSSAHITSSDLRGDCDRCGPANHKENECPTLWRIYQYVDDEERDVILQGREEKKHLAFGEGGEGYIDAEIWCYNCANTGHLGDDCDELPHITSLPLESSAFSAHNIMSSPFYDAALEPVSVRRGPRERESKIDWPRLPDDWDVDAPVDVGKRGKNKDRERLEKRFREQEDETEDWFDDIRNVRRRGMDQQASSSGPRGKTLKIGPIKDGGLKSSSPPSANGSSLLARISDTCAGDGGRRRGKNGRGREQHESSHQLDNSLRIRGAATDQRRQDGKYVNSRKTDWERGQGRWDRDKPGGGSRRDHGPRYKGGYDR